MQTELLDDDVRRSRPHELELLGRGARPYLSSALWTSTSGYITDFLPRKLAPHKGCPSCLRRYLQMGAQFLWNWTSSVRPSHSWKTRLIIWVRYSKRVPASVLESLNGRRAPLSKRGKESRRHHPSYIFESAKEVWVSSPSFFIWYFTLSSYPFDQAVDYFI